MTRRPLPLYDVDNEQIRLCAGDCGVYFRKRDEAEVRRLLRIYVTERGAARRKAAARLERLIVDLQYDPAGSVR